MKFFLSVSIGLLIFIANGFAQTEINNRIYYDGGVPESLNQVDRTIVSCGPDTILYPYLKELVFTAPNDSFFIDAMVGNVRTASQAYHLNDTIQILGIQFWGGKYTIVPGNPATITVRAYLYSVDGLNMPVTKLDSVDFIVGTNQQYYEGNFSVPYTYSQNFAVAVRSVPNDTLSVVTNNAGNVWTPNYGESLGWRRFGSGIWNSSLSFFGQDLEYMIFPIVSYNIDVDADAMDNTVCNGDSADFMNNSSDILSNRMFNLNAFDAQWGFSVTDATFEWNFGDSPSWLTTPTDPSYLYSQGNYDAILRGEMLGYYSSCIDTHIVNTTTLAAIQDTITLTICEGDTINFGSQTITTSGNFNEVFNSIEGCDSTITLQVTVNTVNAGVTINGSDLMADLSGANYQWLDCNNSFSTIPGESGQSFTPLVSGNYAVLVTDVLGCTDTSNCTNFVLGLQNHPFDNLMIYPNPTSGLAHIKSNQQIIEKVEVLNIMGEIITVQQVNSTVVIIDLVEQPCGIYLIRLYGSDSDKTIRIVKN